MALFTSSISYLGIPSISMFAALAPVGFALGSQVALNERTDQPITGMDKWMHTARAMGLYEKIDDDYDDYKAFVSNILYRQKPKYIHINFVLQTHDNNLPDERPLDKTGTITFGPTLAPPHTQTINRRANEYAFPISISTPDSRAPGDTTSSTPSPSAPSPCSTQTSSLSLDSSPPSNTHSPSSTFLTLTSTTGSGSSPVPTSSQDQSSTQINNNDTISLNVPPVTTLIPASATGKPISPLSFALWTISGFVVILLSILGVVKFSCTAEATPEAIQLT